MANTIGMQASDSTILTAGYEQVNYASVSDSIVMPQWMIDRLEEIEDCPEDTGGGGEGTFVYPTTGQLFPRGGK